MFGEHYARMTRFYLRHGNLTRNPGFASPEEITPRERRPTCRHGHAAAVHRAAQRLHEDFGVDYVVFCCRLSTGPSLEETREQILRFGEEVVQPIHARYPAPDHPAIPAACRW